jgi:hypothetical protein
VERRVCLGEKSVWCVEAIVECSLLWEGAGLAIDHLVQVDIGNMKFIGCNSKRLGS